MAEKTYDRTTQDVGNILAMEHVNVTVPDQALALQFYVQTLGLTRDPYMMVGTENMWVNVGEQQFHLPTRAPQVLRGLIGLVVPDLNGLKRRLERAQPKLSGTSFCCAEENGHVSITCPWGNQFRVHAPSPQFGDMTLGIPYLEFMVEPNSALGVAQFYKEIMQAPATWTPSKQGAVACVQVGRSQKLLFRETTSPIPAYDGHHIAIYIANFSAPHAFLKERGLVSEESDNHQYRFRNITDPDSGRTLCELEHEVRSMFHPMWGRELVNRNAGQNIFAYAHGRDVFASQGTHVGGRS
jgi:catechol 2,3-dioxygenase-like lactoylglutathione lyase family enzyme